MDFAVPVPSAPEDPRRVGLDFPQHRPEVRRRGQGIVGVPFPVPVLEILRPGGVGLRDLPPAIESLCGAIPRYNIGAMSGTFLVMRSPFGGAGNVIVIRECG